MTNFINFTKNGITTLINTLPYLPLVFLLMGFLGWALFMVVPTIWRLHNAAYYQFLDNLPFLLIGLCLLGFAFFAYQDRQLKYWLFISVAFMTMHWF